MSDRVNHAAVWTAAIAYFAFGYVWYGLLFSVTWTQLMGKTVNQPPATLAESFVLGLILSYAAAIALTRRPEDQTVSQGIGFAIFMSVAIYATQTLNNTLYEGVSMMVWFINAGYVVIGFAIIGAIVGGWKQKAA